MDTGEPKGLRKINTKCSFVEERYGLSEESGTVAIIYSPHKDVLERAVLATAELEGRKARESHRHKKERERREEKRRERQREIRQVESSGVGSGVAPRFVHLLLVHLPRRQVSCSPLL